MIKTAVVAGTGFEGRALLIREYCHEGRVVCLRREPNNVHDENAIAVYFMVPRLFGLLSPKAQMIGYVKSRLAKSLASKMDSGLQVTGRVDSYYAPEGMEHPRVSLELEY